MATATPLPIPEAAQANMVTYLTSAMTMYGGSFNIRNQLLERDRAYYREQDQSTASRRAAVANSNGDPDKIQNLTVPVVMPQVETALAYYVDMFLSGYPIFGVVAPPAYADALEQFEAIIADNSTMGCWQSELIKVIRDGLKYDLGAVEVVWEKKKTFNIETPELTSLSRGKVKETQYEGNFMYHRSPYNLILDTRVSPDKNHIQGEYAGYTEMLSRIETKKRMDDLDPLGTMNFRKGLESGTPTSTTANNPTGNFYTPQINPSALLPDAQNLEFNWMSWAGMAPAAGKDPIAYRNSYEWTVMYVRIIPRELGINVSDAKSVQIWKFIFLNRQVVIFAERQTNAHNFLPIICCKPSNDGMGYQSKSFGQNVEPTQQVATALQNSGLASQKKKVYDRMLYDPSKVRKQDIENTSTVARIPVRNMQMGKALTEAVYPIPYRDDGVAEVMQMAQQVAAQGDIVNGTNRVQQGQFQKGNKTRQEFDTVMGNSNARQRTGAIGLECTFWTPVKFIVKTNVLQYQPPITITAPQGTKEVQVDPAELRKALFSFKLTDGLLPSEKVIDPTMFSALLQAAPAMPQIQMEYDLMGMLDYSMKLKGAYWVGDFKLTEEQKQQKVAEMQQAAVAAGKAAVPDQQPDPRQDPMNQGAQ